MNPSPHGASASEAAERRGAGTPGDALSAAGRLAREGDEERFLAAMFAPPEKRERLFALIAFNCELAKIPATVSEPMLGEIRLAWWREAIEDLFERGVARPHEAMGALAEAHRAAPLDRALLEGMIDARSVALDGEGLAAPEIRSRFIADTAGAYHRLSMQAMGGDAAAVEVAAKAGWAEGAGRLVLALSHEVREGDGEMAAVLQTLAAEGLAALREARRERGRIARKWRAPLLSVHLAERSLLAAEIFVPAGNFAPQASAFRERGELLLRAMFGRF